ncbi:MAG TPA: methyltransferase domain-containing protein [Nitrospiraceae bacterium]|nr:methyltransferase domain-containing protein [Nitrospiraceae bacterium]
MSHDDRIVHPRIHGARERFHGATHAPISRHVFSYTSQAWINRSRSSITANLDYLTATCYALPFDDASFDCIFSHALVEHLAEPSRALAEFYRILKPGGSIGICSPDWGGFIVSPPSPALSDAMQAYMTLQTKNGGDVLIGRKFGTYLHEAGFHTMSMQARYQCYPSSNLSGEYLARQLARDGQQEHASTWLAWSRSPSGLFAQTWVSAIGRK